MQKEIPTRTSSQIRTHAQKFFIRLRSKLGCDEEQALQYLKTRPASDFVSDSRKFAKLEFDGVEPIHEAQCPQKLPQSASVFAPKILVPTPIRVEVRSDERNFNQIKGRNVVCQDTFPKISHTPQAVSKSEVDSGRIIDHTKVIDIAGNLKEQIPASKTFSITPLAGVTIQVPAPEPRVNPFMAPPIRSSLSAIAQESLVLNQNVGSSFSAMNAFSQKLEAVNEPSKHADYLKSSTTELERILQNVANSLTKSNSLIEQLLTQIYVWSEKTSPSTAQQ